MENTKNLESEKIFIKYFNDEASYHNFIFLLFQNLKDNNFKFNDTKISKKDLIENMEKNINYLIIHIKELGAKESKDNKEKEI